MMGSYNLKQNDFLNSGFNLKRFFILISIIFIVSYGIFSARNIILGPSIELMNPAQKELEVRDSAITIKGRVKNITSLSLNERKIFVDTEGLFEEKLLLSPGSNIIEIKAKDRFKNETKETLKVYYKQTLTALISEKVLGSGENLEQNL